MLYVQSAQEHETTLHRELPILDLCMQLSFTGNYVSHNFLKCL